MNIRFLPLMIIFTFGVTIVKIADLIEGSAKYSNIFLISELNAEPNIELNNKTQIDLPKNEQESNKSSAAINSNSTKSDNINNQFSDIEVDLLKSLANRRLQLDQREYDIINKEQVLKATELKIEDKLSKLNNLKEQLDKLLEAYNQKEDEKINNLVKIYENMKPKDAAKIFESLDMEILLSVISKMKQLKSAAIIAMMNPQKATELTAKYINQKKISSNL